MKITWRSLLICLLVLSFSTSFGQSDFKEPCSKYIDSLVQNGDTVISLEKTNYYEMMLKSHIPGIGMIYLSHIQTVLNSNKGKWSAVKFVSWYDNSTNTFVSKKSFIRTLYPDSNLTKVKNLVFKISGDMFLPYIGEFENNGIKSYSILNNSPHRTIHELIVKTREYHFTQTIQDEDLEKRRPDIEIWPANLNYEYNSHLPLYSFYSSLAKVLENHEWLFQF